MWQKNLSHYYVALTDRLRISRQVSYQTLVSTSIAGRHSPRAALPQNRHRQVERLLHCA